MRKLTLSTAETIISAAFEKAAELNLKPLTVAVLDAGGHAILLKRQDGSSIMRPQIATGKAIGALAVGTGTRWLNANAESRPHFVNALNGVSGGAIVPVPGGVLVKNDEGETISPNRFQLTIVFWVCRWFELCHLLERSDVDR